MLRELNENEMEMVSGGELVPFNPFLDPTSSLEEQAEAARQYERFFGGGSGGSSSTGPVGWGPNGDRGFFEQVGNILDNPATETGIALDSIVSEISDLHEWLQDNNLYGCLAPVHISNSCG